MSVMSQHAELMRQEALAATGDEFAWHVARYMRDAESEDRLLSQHTIQAFSKAEAVEEALNRATNGQVWKFSKRTFVKQVAPGAVPTFRVLVSVKRKLTSW